MDKGLKITGWLMLIIWAPMIYFLVRYTTSQGFEDSIIYLFIFCVILLCPIFLIKKSKNGLYAAVIITSIVVYIYSEAISPLSWDWKTEYLFIKSLNIPLYRQVLIFYVDRIFLLCQLVLLFVFLVLIYINRKPSTSDLSIKQYLISYLFACLVPAIILGGWYGVIHYQMYLQQKRNNILEKEISRIDSQIPELLHLEKKRQELLELMFAYQEIRGESPVGFISLLPTLSDSIPDSVSLQKISYHYEAGSDSQLLSLQGVSLSKEVVSKLEQSLRMSLSTDKSQTNYSIDEDVKSPVGFNMKMSYLSQYKIRE